MGAPALKPHNGLHKAGIHRLHFTDEDTKAQRSEIISRGHTTVSPVEPGFKPVSPGYKVHTLNFLTNLLLHEMCRAMPILQVRRLMLKRVKAIAKKPKEEPGCKLGAAALLYPAVQCYDQIHRGELQHAALRGSQARGTP